LIVAAAVLKYEGLVQLMLELYAVSLPVT